MNYSPRKRYSRATHALLLSVLFAVGIGVCAHVSRAQESAALPTVRLVSALEGYDGPSSFSARPALLSFSPNGRTVAVSTEGRLVMLYDAATGKQLFTLSILKLKEGFSGFAFAPDSRTAATRSTLDHSVALWDLATGKLMQKFEGRKRNSESKLKASMRPTVQVVPVPFSPDGRRLVTGGADKTAFLYGIS